MQSNPKDTRSTVRCWVACIYAYDVSRSQSAFAYTIQYISICMVIVVRLNRESDRLLIFDMVLLCSNSFRFYFIAGRLPKLSTHRPRHHNNAAAFVGFFWFGILFIFSFFHVFRCDLNGACLVRREYRRHEFVYCVSKPTSWRGNARQRASEKAQAVWRMVALFDNGVCAST